MTNHDVKVCLDKLDGIGEHLKSLSVSLSDVGLNELSEQISGMAGGIITQSYLIRNTIYKPIEAGDFDELKREKERIHNALDYMKHVTNDKEYYVTVYLGDVRDIVNGVNL